MKLIDRILIKDLGFETTTKDRCIYIEKIQGHTLLLLRQVDNFCCACTDEKDAKNIYNLIGTKIQSKSERKKSDIPFEYLGLVQDYYMYLPLYYHVDEERQVMRTGLPS